MAPLSSLCRWALVLALILRRLCRALFFAWLATLTTWPHASLLPLALRCAAVLWYASDWFPPSDFAAVHVPVIERFVRDGGGLLVGGLGWSYQDQGLDVLELPPGSELPPYAADELGKPFGFTFTLDAFTGSADQPIPLLGAR